MKKKIALLVFTLLCTAGLVAGVASYTLGKNNTSKYYNDTGNNLSSVYSSFYTIVQHIIDNSNSTEEGVDTVYHIVQIVDSMTAKDSANKELYAYLEEYIKNGDGSDDAGSFRIDVLGKAMKEGKIEIQTFLANDSDLADAIRNADLVYFACNINGYTGDLDIANTAFNTSVYSALEKYVFSDFRPIMIDSNIIGVTSSDIDVTEAAQTNIYKFLKKNQNTSGTSSDHGVFSFKAPSVTWGQHFDMNTTDSNYISFNNGGTKVWNKYDYSSYVHKVLEIVPDKTGTDSKELKASDVLVDPEVVSGNRNDSFLYAFSEIPTNMKANKNLSITTMNMSEVNALTASDTKALLDYDFIYISHSSTTPVYYAESDKLNDASDSTITALKEVLNYSSWDKYAADKGVTVAEAKKALGDQEYVKRIIVDNNFFKAYNYSSDSNSTSVDTNTSIYGLLSNMVKVGSDNKATAILRNVLVTSSGYFGSMTDEKAQAVTDLINRSSYRSFSGGTNGKNFRVLEIEPYATVDKTDWFNEGASRQSLTESLENTKYQEEYEEDTNEPFYRYNMTEARIAAVTGLSIDQISLTKMTANGLCSTSPNLLEEFDLIYIGGNNDNVKDKEDWYAWDALKNVAGNEHGLKFYSFNKVDVDNFYFNGSVDSNAQYDSAYVYTSYSHTGDITYLNDQRSMFGNDTGGENVEGSFTRTNGTDITAKIYLKLYDFINAGMPVVLDKSVMDADYTIGGAASNADMKENADYVIQDSATSDTTLNRLVLDGEEVTETSKNKNIKYKYIKYSTDTLEARKNSEIDPESYMYQLLYRIAENTDDDIYHAPNVYVGFDSTETENVSNSYIIGATSDKDATQPDDIDLVSNASNVLSSVGDTLTLFKNKLVKNADNTINYAKSGIGVRLKHFLNCYATSRPIISLTQAPIDYDSNRDLKKSTRIENDKSPTFAFEIFGVRGMTYTVTLYYDFDGDNKYSDTEVDGRIEGTRYDDEIVAETTYNIGDGTVTFKEGAAGVTDDFVIDEDFVGVMPYKLVVTDENGKKTAVTGTPKYYSDDDSNKTDLKLLQIIPGYADGHTHGRGADITVLDVNQYSDCEGGRKGGVANKIESGDNSERYHLNYDDPDDNKDNTEFGIVSYKTEGMNLATSLQDEYDIDLTVMTTGQFGEMCNAYLEYYIGKYQDGDFGSDLSSEETDLFDNFISEFYSGGKLSNKWKNDITDFSSTTKWDFNKFTYGGKECGIPDTVMISWLRYGDPEADPIAIETKHCAKDWNDATSDNGVEQKYVPGYFDMIICGFAAGFGSGVSGVEPSADMTNIACQFLRAYLRDDGPAMMGTDFTSFEGFYCTTTMKWSRNINEYLRGELGMDRFKFSDGKQSVFNKTGSNLKSFYDGGPIANLGYTYSFEWVPYSTSSYSGEEAEMPGEYFTKYTYNDTYESYDSGRANGRGLLAGSGATDLAAYYLNAYTKGSNVNNTVFKDVKVFAPFSAQSAGMGFTTKIAQNNKGLLTSYPFNISSKATISCTNGQSMALDTESDYLTVWYSMAGSDESTDSGESAYDGGSSLYAADPLNGRSFYYMYTYKNITYTAAGYEALVDSKSDNEDERELIINAILSKCKMRRSGPKLVFNEFENDNMAAENETEKTVHNMSKFTAANKSNTAVLDLTSQLPLAASFDFTMTTDSSRHFTDVYMFISSSPEANKPADSKKVIAPDLSADSKDVILQEWHSTGTTSGDAKEYPLYNVEGEKENKNIVFVANGKSKVKLAIQGDAEELKDYMEQYISKGSFYITVYAKDSAGKDVSKRILIKTTTTMFDLT